VNTLLITSREVTARLARGERLVFVDCRSEQACNEVRVRLPGAVRAAPGAIAEAANGLRGHGATVVAYGDHGWEESPVHLVECLRARGWTQVRILAGGLRAWSALGLPAEGIRDTTPALA
jgi:rhodanese-related sulfurtransferase